MVLIHVLIQKVSKAFRPIHRYIFFRIAYQDQYLQHNSQILIPFDEPKWAQDPGQPKNLQSIGNGTVSSNVADDLLQYNYLAYSIKQQCLGINVCLHYVSSECFQC